MTTRFASLFVLVSSLVGFGCSAASSAGSTTRNGAGTGSSGSAAGAGSGINVMGDPTTSDPSDMRDVPVRKKVCDAAGNCTCLRLAMLGTLTSAAADTDTSAFVDWLNNNSSGTATLTNVPSKPSVDATFLGQYDILLVANVNTWTFSADEKAAVQKWVTETGGGIITLTGFQSTPAERDASSQIISFAGLDYGSSKSTTPGTAPMTGQQKPVYAKGGSTDLRNCLWRNGAAAVHGSPGITTPIKFTPQLGSLSKLTLGLDQVGAFIGWPVTAPSGATVLAKDPVTGGNMAVAYEVDGKGRIFAFGDEWVIFTNEWVPEGQATSTQMDSGNPCWVPPSGNAPGFFQTVETIYQTKQFWYDAINWVAPPNECNFVVVDPDVIIK